MRMGKGFGLGSEVKAELQARCWRWAHRGRPGDISRPASPEEKQIWVFRSVSWALVYGGVCGEPHEQEHGGHVPTAPGWPEGSIPHRRVGGDSAPLSRR